MSIPREVKLVRLFSGIIAAGPQCLASAREQLTQQFGPIHSESEVIPFTFTDYYEEEMGPDLLRQFLAFRHLIDPADIAGIKLCTNTMEQAMAKDGRRTVNLDPGYITPAKVVLATAKNYAHRVYLRDGIYAEVTLHFTKDDYQFYDWTFPDYKSEPYLTFFRAVREALLDAPPHHGGEET